MEMGDYGRGQSQGDGRLERQTMMIIEGQRCPAHELQNFY